MRYFSSTNRYKTILSNDIQNDKDNDYESIDIKYYSTSDRLYAILLSYDPIFLNQIINLIPLESQISFDLIKFLVSSRPTGIRLPLNISGKSNKGSLRKKQEQRNTLS